MAHVGHGAVECEAQSKFTPRRHLPAAAAVERRVMEWLAPCFGMSGGLMTSGSTLSNLSALWAARERVGIRRVVASTSAHISIAKSANLLGLELYEIPSSQFGVLDIDALPDNLDDAALVLTAGTTGTGVIDPLSRELNAAWRHVDAAWAGPLNSPNTLIGSLELSKRIRCRYRPISSCFNQRSQRW